MNPHRPRMNQRVIKEIRETYLNQKLSNKNLQFPSTTTINAPGIIRTIPSLQQQPVLAALLAQHRLLRLQHQLHQLVPPKSVLPSPSSSYSGATAPYSHGSPGTPKTTTSFRSSTPTSEAQTSAESPAHSRSLPSNPSTPSSVRSKPWFREVIDNASRSHQFGDGPTQAQPQRNLRNSTTQQRKAQPLWKTKIPPDLSEFNSPASSKKKRKVLRLYKF